MSNNGNAYLKYSGMAFQMFVLLLIAIFLGKKVDDYFRLPEAIFTITFAIIALVAYLIKLYLDVVNGKL